MLNKIKKRLKRYGNNLVATITKDEEINYSLKEDDMVNILIQCEDSEDE